MDLQVYRKPDIRYLVPEEEQDDVRWLVKDEQKCGVELKGLL